MATTVDFHRLADAEVMSIRRYYARAGQSAKFISALHDAVARVGTSPGMWSPDALGTRACPLQKFPYRLVYIEEPGRILVVAVPHDRRRPGYWRRRVS